MVSAFVSHVLYLEQMPCVRKLIGKYNLFKFTHPQQGIKSWGRSKRDFFHGGWEVLSRRFRNLKPAAPVATTGLIFNSRKLKPFPDQLFYEITK